MDQIEMTTAKNECVELNERRIIFLYYQNSF